MELIVLFVDICLFKKGPQDVPASQLLFALTLVAYWIVGILLLGLQSDWLEATTQAVIESLLLIAFCWAVLRFARMSPRFLQTTTALLATDALISLPGALLLSWWLARPEAAGLQFALLGLTLWHLAVFAQVLRQALSRPLTVGAALAVAYVGLTYTIMSIIFPSLPA
jgi:hypothetical protein